MISLIKTHLRMHFDIRWDLFHPTFKIKQYKPTLAIEPKDSPMFLEGQHIEMTCVKHLGPPPTRLTFVRGRHSTEVNLSYIKRLNGTAIKVLVDFFSLRFPYSLYIVKMFKKLFLYSCCTNILGLYINV